MKTAQKIRVYDYSPFWVEEVTVQTYENDVMVHCNHANAKTVTESFEIPRINQPDIVSNVKILACDKCPAWSYDGVEWHDE